MGDRRRARVRRHAARVQDIQSARWASHAGTAARGAVRERRTRVSDTTRDAVVVLHVLRWRAVSVERGEERDRGGDAV